MRFVQSSGRETKFDERVIHPRPGHLGANDLDIVLLPQLPLAENGQFGPRLDF